MFLKIRRKLVRRLLLPLTATVAVYSSVAVQAESEELILTVNAPYIDVHTGPGRGYPIFYVVERDDQIEVLKQRTDWFSIRVQDRSSEKEGWVHRDHLTGSLYQNGDVADFSLPGRLDLAGNRWMLTGMGGDFAGADSLSFTLGYRMTQNLSIEGRVGRAVGDFSDSEFAYARISSQPFPEWRISPFFVLGSGVIYTSPNTQLVQAEDREDAAMLVGLGVQSFLSRAFTIRLEYNQHLVLTNREINEDVNEWQLGFSVSF